MTAGVLINDFRHIKSSKPRRAKSCSAAVQSIRPWCLFEPAFILLQPQSEYLHLHKSVIFLHGDSFTAPRVSVLELVLGSPSVGLNFRQIIAHILGKRNPGVQKSM